MGRGMNMKRTRMTDFTSATKSFWKHHKKIRFNVLNIIWDLGEDGMGARQSRSFADEVPCEIRPLTIIISNVM